MKNVIYFHPLEFVFYFVGLQHKFSSQWYIFKAKRRRGFLSFFKWKENLGKIILCMNFFCDTSWAQVADFCCRVALWPFFKHLRLSSEVHWIWWDMILKYGAFKKKNSSKYIIFSARHVSHCQDESRLNAKFLVNCICVVGVYSQSNTLAVCVEHTKTYHFIMGHIELWILWCE